MSKSSRKSLTLQEEKNGCRERIKVGIIDVPASVFIGIAIGIVICYFWLSEQPFWLGPLIRNACEATKAAQLTITPVPTYTPIPPTPTPTITPTPTGTPTLTPTPSIIESKMVAIRTSHNRYVTAMNDQPGWNWELRAETNVVGDWERFVLLYLDNGRVALKTYHGRFVSAMDNSGCCNWVLRAEKRERGVCEEFTLVDLGNGKVAFETCHGRYVTAFDSGRCWMIRADAQSVGSWEQFTLVPKE